MTPKIIGLKQAPVVLVELPVNFSEPTGISLGSFSDWSVQNLDTGEYYGLGQDLKTMGILSDLTEEQFAECVDSLGSVWNDGSKVYENYKESVPKKRTAKDSFYSLLESENVYTENPKGKQPTKYKGKDLPKQVRKEMYSFAMQKWQEAQSRTIDPTITIILLKKNKS